MTALLIKRFARWLVGMTAYRLRGDAVETSWYRDAWLRQSLKQLHETGCGWGRVMQMTEELWRAEAIADGVPGIEHTHGPCAGLLVPCSCAAAIARSADPIGCDWCCGSGRVTERVRSAMTQLGETDVN